MFADWSGGKKDPPCRKCGRKKVEHCDFEPVEIPDGCVCDPRDWADPTGVPGICSKFEADYSEDWPSNMCSRCEHDYECHKNRDDLVDGDQNEDGRNTGDK